MPLGYRYEETGEEDGALLLPYPPDTRGGKTNHGFQDLRGKPEEARKIAEALPSPAFQDLLAQLAAEDTPFFSVGCELGGMPITMPDGPGFTAGAYLQIARSDLHNPEALELGEQKALANKLRLHLQERVGDHHWLLEFIVTVIGTEALGGPDQIWSPLIYMHANAATEVEARASAEAYYTAVRDFLR